MVDVGTAINALTSYVGIFLLLAVIAVAIKLDDIILYIGLAVVGFVVSASLVDTYWQIALFGVILSCFLIYKALMQALNAGGSARGFSQLRGIWESIRGRF